MADAWKADYLASMTSDSGHLVSDFREEIEEHFEPYARRLVTCKLATQEEAGALLGYVYDRWLEVRDAYEAFGKLSSSNPFNEVRGIYE